MTTARTAKSPVISDEAPERPFQYIRETRRETLSASRYIRGDGAFETLHGARVIL